MEESAWRRGGASPRAHEVLQRDVVEAHVAQAGFGGLVGVEVLERRPVGQQVAVAEDEVLVEWSGRTGRSRSGAAGWGCAGPRHGQWGGGGYPGENPAKLR
jgi:hypothetical protein